MIDLSNVSDRDLARWARARITADASTIRNLIAQAGQNIYGDDEYEPELDLASGEVKWSDEDGDWIYVLGPSTMLVASADYGELGRGSRIWRDGKLVSDLGDGKDWAS